GDPGGDRRGRVAVPDGEAVRQLAGAVPQHGAEQPARDEALAAAGVEPAAAGAADVRPVGRPDTNAAGGVLSAGPKAPPPAGRARPGPTSGPAGCIGCGSTAATTSSKGWRGTRRRCGPTPSGACARKPRPWASR